MANEESEVHLNLLEQNNSSNDDNNNLQIRTSSGNSQEADESFADEATVHSDDPLSKLISSSQQLGKKLDYPKVVIVPSKGSLAQSCTSIASTKKHGLELVWRNLSYEITKKSCIPFRKATSRKLIHNLNGGIQSGHLTAIIGPSGAGW